MRSGAFDLATARAERGRTGADMRLVIDALELCCTRGLLKDGGSGRRNAVEKLIKSAGGKLESVYFAFGEDDVFVVADVPDNTTAAGRPQYLSGQGGVTCMTGI